MFRKTPIFIVLAMLLGTATLSAQTPPKYGHMNLGNLLEAMPETKAANDKLKVYADSLSGVGEKMAKTFQEEVKKFQADYQHSNPLPPGATISSNPSSRKWKLP